MIDTKELRRLAQAAMHPVTKGRWMRLFGERTVYDRMEDGCRGIPVVSTPISPPHPFEAACLDFIAAANPAVISELLDRLEAAEADALEQARLNGTGSEREAALMAKLEAAEKDIAIKEEVIDSLATVIKRLDAQCDAAEKERDDLRAENAALVDDMNLLRDNNTALRSKIEAAENDDAHQKALAASALRVAEGWERKCDTLRAKIEQMEKQEPVVEVQWAAGIPNGILDFISTDGYLPKLGDKLYALPGAQGEEK